MSTLQSLVIIMELLQYFLQVHKKTGKELKSMNKERLAELIEKNKNIDLEDDFAHNSIWKEMFEILSQNLNDTITFLDNITAAELEYIRSIFEDLSEHFKSQELIECMERNALRTGVDCSIDIEYAKKALV